MVIIYQSVVESVAAHAAARPERLCLVDSSNELTYRDAWELTVGFCDTLREAGVAKGDHVVIECNQGVEFVIALLGVQLFGAVAVPIERNASSSRRTAIAEKMDVAAFVGPKESLEFAGARFIPCGETHRSAGEWPGGFPASRDISEIMFSTGTTGIPKGVVLEHRNDRAMCDNIISGLEMKPDVVELIIVPLNHSFGLRRTNANLVNGSTVVIANGALAMKQNFDFMDRYHVNALSIPCNTLSVVFKLTGDRLGAYADALDYVQVSSAMLAEADKERLVRLLPRTRLYNFYGSTEAGATCLYDFNAMANKPHCIGRPIGTSRFIVVDDERRPIESSAKNMGILASTGDVVMREYFDEPELTRETLVDGFVYTKDLGYIDGDGLVYILGRVDDVINFGGIKVAPEEIEAAVAENPSVADCACVAVPDELSGQAPVLCIVLEEGAVYDEREFKRFLAGALGPTERPQRVVVVDEVPRAYNGKIRRRELVERLA